MPTTSSSLHATHLPSRAPTRPYSFSKLDRFGGEYGCPRRYYLEQICRAPTVPSPALEMGTHTHTAIEVATQKALERGDESLSEEQWLKDAWADQAPPEVKASLTNLAPWLKNNWQRIFNTLEVEGPFAFTFEPGRWRPELKPMTWSGDRRDPATGSILRGKLDLLWRQDSISSMILDFKTGKNAYEVPRRVEDLPSMAPQLLVYALAVFAVSDIEKVCASYFNTRLCTIPEVPIWISREEAINLGSKWITDRVEALESRRWDAIDEWEPTPHRYCDFCDFAEGCPGLIKQEEERPTLLPPALAKHAEQEPKPNGVPPSGALPDGSFLIEEPAEEYHSKRSEFITSHLLADFRKSPKLFHRVRGGLIPDVDRPAYLIGRAAHTLILEGEKAFDEQYAFGGPVNPKTNKPYGRQTKKFEEWAEQQEGIALTDEQVALIHDLHQAFKEHEEATKLLARGVAEGVLRIDYQGLPCQVRIDWYSPGHGIVDLKTCDNMTWFEADAKKFGYINQLGFYRAVVESAANIRIPVHMIAVEKKEPFRVGVWRIGEDVLGIAQQENEEAMGRLKKCLEEDRWESGYEAIRTFDSI